MAAIDRAFDGLDRGLTSVGKIFGIERDERTTTPSRYVSVPTQKQLPRKVTFRIEGPYIDAETGKEHWLVTDGHAARAECDTLEFAKQLLAALETPK